MEIKKITEEGLGEIETGKETHYIVEYKNEDIQYFIDIDIFKYCVSPLKKEEILKIERRYLEDGFFFSDCLYYWINVFWDKHGHLFDERLYFDLSRINYKMQNFELL